MNKMSNAAGAVLAIILAIVAFFVCTTRIETGYVGLRTQLDKQVQPEELLPGSWNQNVIGSIRVFPVKEVAGYVEDMKPQTADNVVMAEVDATVVYNINPTAVSELYTNQSRSFHAVDNEGHTLLMYSYVTLTAQNALNKVIGKYAALKIVENRAAIEKDARDEIEKLLAANHLAGKITISQVQLRKVSVPQSLIDAANQLVQTQKALERKNVEVDIAKAEARRLAELSNLGQQSIEFMNAQARLNISKGVENCKSSVVVPYDFKGIVSAK